MRDSVVIYKSFHEASKMLPPLAYKELWTQLFEYALNDDEPEFTNTLGEIIFTMAQPQIDANKKRHDDGCRGGRPRKPPVIEEENHRLQKQKPNENENVNENVNENDIKKENIKEKAPKAPRTQKEEKHIFGEYKHVRLTDKQHEKLAVDFGEEKRDAAIKRLDEYIQEKGYKSSDHNLAIRRWGIKAVEEDRAKPKKTNDLMMRHNYDFDEIERRLLAE